MSYNTDTGHELSDAAFLREFLDHYYPTADAPAPTDMDPHAQALRVAGEYRFNRMSYTTFQRALGLRSPITVSPGRDGSLLMASQRGDMRLIPAGPWLYRDELGTDLVAFKTDASGKVSHGFIGSLPMMVMERVPWYQSPRLRRDVLGVAVAVFILTVWSALVRTLRRRFGRLRADDFLPGRGLVVGAAAADLAFIVASAVLLSNATALMTGSPVGFELALALPVVGAVLACMAVIVAIKQWIDHVGRPSSRLLYAALVVVLLFTWSLNEWNLLGWKF